VSAGTPPDLELGELLQELVNRVSHLQGKTLTVLTEESVTLQQVLLLRRLKHLGESTPSKLAELMHMSLPAVSQMIERLFQLKLLTRREASDDRRRKHIALTPRACDVLERVRKARAAEYAAGVCGLSRKVRAELVAVLTRALRELPVEAEALAAVSQDAAAIGRE